MIQGFFKSLAKSHDVSSVAVQWRLTVPMFFGAVAACVLWLLILDRLLGTIVWFLITGIATVAGVVWDRQRNRKPGAK